VRRHGGPGADGRSRDGRKAGGPSTGGRSDDRRARRAARSIRRSRPHGTAAPTRDHGHHGAGTTNAHPGRHAAGSPTARRPAPPDADPMSARTVRTTRRRHARRATGNRTHRARDARRTPDRARGRRGADTTNAPRAGHGAANPGRRHGHHDVRTGLHPAHGHRARTRRRGGPRHASRTPAERPRPDARTADDRPRHASRTTAARPRHASRTTAARPRPAARTAASHRGRHGGAHPGHPTETRRTARARHHRRGRRIPRCAVRRHQTPRPHPTTSSTGHRSTRGDRHGRSTSPGATDHRNHGSRRRDRRVLRSPVGLEPRAYRTDVPRRPPTTTFHRRSCHASRRDRHARHPEDDCAGRTSHRHHPGSATPADLRPHDQRRHDLDAPTNLHRHERGATLRRRTRDGRRRRLVPGRGSRAPTPEQDPAVPGRSPSRRYAEDRHPSFSTNDRPHRVPRSDRPDSSRDRCRRRSVGRGYAPRRCRCSSCDCSPRPDQRSMLSSRPPEPRPTGLPADVTLATPADAGGAPPAAI